jgi:death-on-curing protein
MPERISLTLAEVVEIDRLLIEEFGGSHGVRDQGGLESAGYRPKTGYYNNLAEEAAALAESLANNHAFLMGTRGSDFRQQIQFFGSTAITWTWRRCPRMIS